MPDYRRLGGLVRDARRAKNVTQVELGAALGLSRESVSGIERGRPKKPIDPEHINKIGQMLDVPVLKMVIALGYELDFEGVEGEEEVELLQAYRVLEAADRRAVRRVTGLPAERPPRPGLDAVRLLAATDRQGDRETQE